jgi:polysaccharide pyruvyl transferase WcaK-like protein
MNILVENNCVDLQNMGDVAMLQVAVERLGSRWPQAVIRVVTARPDLLARYCPGTEAVSAAGRAAWFYGRNLFGKVHGVVPSRVDAALTGFAETIRRRNPRLLQGVLSLKAKAHGRDTGQMDVFVNALLDADLLVVSGGGDINDTFVDFTLTLLEVLEVARRQGTPAIMFGQGIGPLGIPSVKTRARAVLPYVALTGVREGLASVQALESLDVPSDSIYVTGDDAIEMAYARRGEELGSAIGVNVRVSSYSLMDTESMADCRAVLNRLASRHKTSFVPVPISFYPGESDIEAVAALVGERFHMPTVSGKLDEPASIIDLVQKCRVVLTGSYHSAVFALSQGIPAVGMARSQYYRSKFLGLMDQFDTECDVVSVDDDSFPEMLYEAAERAWDNAERWRPGLLGAARRQIEAGTKLYDEAYRLVESRLAAGVGGGREYV